MGTEQGHPLGVTDTPEPRPARQAINEMLDAGLLDELMDRVDAGELTLTGEGGFLPEMVKAVLERGLQAELTGHLGYEKGDRAGRGSPNSRNGTTPKTLATEVGNIGLDVPRDRASTFEPRLVPKGARRAGGLDEMIVSLYAGGMTVRDIQHHLARTLGTELSHDTISTYWETETADELADLADDPTDDEDQQPGRGRHPGIWALQGPPRRSAAGGHRDGGHPLRGPGAVLDLPRRHRRHRDHPHHQGRPGRVGAAPAGLGRRPRVRLRGQPRLPHPRRRALHPRREAAADQHRGRRRAGPPRPLPHGGRQPAGQGGRGGPGRGRRRRWRRVHPTVRDLPQPRTSRPRPAGPHQPGHPPHPAHRRLGQLDRAAPRRAGRIVEGQAGVAPLPAPHQERAAAGRPRRDQAGVPSGRQVAAAHLRPHPHPRRPGRRLQAATRRGSTAGATSKAPSGCVRSSTTARTASAPTSSCAGSRYCCCG